MKKHLLTDKTKKIIRKSAKVLLWLTVFAIVFVTVCNIIVIASSNNKIISFDEAAKLEDIDCIIVLGAFVREDGTLSTVLEERVSMGAELYKSGTTERILMSGDHSRKDYNEVGAMKDYAVSLSVSPDAIFTDHAGFDTYDTMYRAKEIFKAKKVIIVTQQFHISRAVFIAESLGLDAYGVACDSEHRYFNLITETREIIARTKYVFDAIFKPKPVYLGEAIPIWGEASLSDG